MAFVGIARAGVLAPLAAVPSISQYSSIPAPTLLTAPTLQYAAAPAFVRAAPLAYSSAFAYTAPIAYAAPAPIAYTAPAVVGAIPGEAKYTALNRGALHEAPLPGHALSQTSLNLEPAPGTF